MMKRSIQFLWLTTYLFLPNCAAQTVVTAMTGVTYAVSTMLVDPYEKFATPASVSSRHVLTQNLDSLEQNLARTNLQYYQGRFLMLYPEYAITSIKVIENRTLARAVAQDAADLGTIPCRSFDSTLVSQTATHRLSCMASNYQIYLVVSLIERETCNSPNGTCREDNLNLYVTTLAFNASGSVVARYRRGHLYEEGALDVPAEVQPTSFTASFGVAFGILSSFDLMFEFPAMALLHANITEILVPFALPGMLPFLTPMQVLSGWRTGVNVNSPRPVNVLASCYSGSSQGFAGCGHFYGGNRGSISVMFGPHDIADDEIFAAELSANITVPPADVQQRASQPEIGFGKYNLTDFTSRPLNVTSEISHFELCHNEQCCTIQYEYAEPPPEGAHYQMLVFDGVLRHPDGRVGWRAQVCGVVACSGEEVQSCADPPPEYVSRTNFSVLHIEAVFHTDLLLPTALHEDYFPFLPDLFDVRAIDAKHHGVRLSHFPQQPFSHVYVFALHTRHFQTLDFNNTNSMGSGIKPSTLVVITFIAITFASFSVVSYN